MKRYFYLDKDNAQHGPCTKAELHTAGVTAQTYVWFAGMKEWEEAGSVDELKSLFETQQPTPPAFEPQRHHHQASPMDIDERLRYARPASGLIWAILATIFCCLPCGVVAIVYAARVEYLWDIGNYERAMSAAKNARNWTLVSVFSSVILWILYMILVMTLTITPMWFMQHGYWS